MPIGEGGLPDFEASGSLPAAPIDPDTFALAPRSAGFPIVGIGASAGGLAAFEAFFSGMPASADIGIAFVLVQHLAPDRESLLTSLLQRFTRLKVLEIVDGMRVRPDCVYVIPSAHNLSLLNGCLQLMPYPAVRQLQLPIDHFFKSLADDLRDRAIGVAMSGTGHDGTLGLKAIKARGGMAMVQTPESAEFDGMPRSAIAAGLADYTLEPSQMVAHLIAYVQHAIGTGSNPIADLPTADPGVLSKIHLLLRSRTGHDFSQYKSGTMMRRIERRMRQQGTGALQEYLQLVQRAPAELDNLFAELLIGVTRFFRDAGAFEALAELCIAPLFAGRAADDPVRVWCAGCSTGEEAYSIAMLLAEHAQAAANGAAVQVFATDIDRRAVAVARAGVYAAGIADDVSPDRLRRFFTAQSNGGYRVQKHIRDRMVFSEHDLLMDPPFSRLDLLVCRNVLIYLGEQVQKRLIPLFHYALRPGGTLLLGTSESLGEAGDLFTTLDRRAKLYRREALAAGRRAVQQRFVLPSIIGGRGATAAAAGPPVRPTSLRELAERALLTHLEPVAALVTSEGEVAYLHGRSGLFLEPAPGDAQVSNILRMAREGLAPALRAALQKGVQSGSVVRANGVRVKTNGEHSLVDLVVRPLPPGAAALDRALYLVVLSLAAAQPELAAPAGALEPPAAAAQQIAQLQAELQAKDEYLLSSDDQLLRANEELTAINEEAQSINEELQSTNEELETSREELQSVNEELITANTELEDKLRRLTESNNDMNNLLTGTGIATLFLDTGMRVLRFTPALSTIINLIPGDTGRPLAHIASNLVGYATLVADCQAVMDSLVPQTHEVQTAEGRWYTLRILPYRTLDNLIEGTVISFFEITENVRTREELKRANAYMRDAALLRDTADAISVHALDGHILAWNPAAERLYGWTEAEALQLRADERIPPALRDDERKRLARVAGKEPMQAYRSQRLTKDGAVLEVSVVMSNLLDASGAVYAAATTERAHEAELP